MIKRWINYCLVGMVGGGVGGMLGVGGGIIMVPLLTWLGLTQKRAQGTSLSATIPLAIVSAASYFHAGRINLLAALPLAAGGVIGAYLGAGLVRYLSNRLLYRLFGVMLLIIAARHAITVLATAEANQAGGTFPLLALLAGVAAGFVSGFFGVGGGVIFVPTGVQLLSLNERSAHGSSFIAIIPTALIGFIRYYRTGEIQRDVIPPLILGAIIGGLAGANVAVGIADVPLALIFAAFLGIVALRRLLGKNPQGK
jgi:hypothetical protein